MKKLLLLLLFSASYLMSCAQTYNHNTKVKIQTVNELESLPSSTKVMVLDASTNEIKYVTAEDLLALVDAGNIYTQDGSIPGGVHRIMTIGDEGSLTITDPLDEYGIFIDVTNFNMTKQNISLQNPVGGSFESLDFLPLEIDGLYGLRLQPGDSGSLSTIEPGSFLTTLDEFGTTEWTVLDPQLYMEGYNSTGTVLGYDLVITLGDYEAGGSEGKFIFDLAENQFYTRKIRAEEFYFSSLFDANYTRIIYGSPPSNVTLSLPQESGPLALVGQVSLNQYNVATLPASPNVGDLAYVDDALTPAYRATVVGGGSEIVLVFFDGTNWICH